MENYEKGLARFTFSGFADEGEQDPFGVWGVPAMDERTADGDGLTWRAVVPGELDGRQIIEARSAMLARGTDHLTRAEGELQAFIASAAPVSNDSLADGAVSFGTGDPTSEGFYAEKQSLREMLTGFAALDAPQLTGEVSFGAGDVFAKKRDREGLRDAYRRWQAFVARVQQMVSQYARVETVVGGVPVGLTRVNWTGDFETHWTPGLPVLSRETHRQTVNLALASRIALLRVVSVITTGAAGLIVKAVALPPGGQVLLIPAARRFVLDVMKTLREAGS